MVKLAAPEVQAEAQPPTKKAKVEEVAPEPEPELETNAAADKGPKISEKVRFLVQDTTVNVADSTFGNMLTCLTDGGMQFLLAGARANVGMKSGRYMFEVNVVELMHQKQDTAATAGKVPQPRNFFRIGLSTAGSSLMIGEDTESICFDAEGCLIHNKKKSQVGAKFERSMTVCVLVNLDAGSANANTISVFKDGVRICKPQALPEELKGKTLFPTITYRNVTCHYNFGATAAANLPFTCRMFQDASAKDVAVTKDAVPADGMPVAVFPCGLPDEGTFQWLDAWLQENPGYTELSDRAVLDWAQKSGINRLKPYGSRVCNDKPDMGFGLPLMDDRSIQKMIAETATLQKRNFVVMEVHRNLIKEDRAKLLTSFDGFRKVCMVVAGEPSQKFKALTQDSIREEKQEVLDAEHKKKCDEAKKKRDAEKKKKDDAKKKKAAEKATKKAAEDRKKKLAEVLKKKEDDKKAALKKKKDEEFAKKKEEAEANGEPEPKEEEDVEMKEEEKPETKEEEKEESEEEAEDEPMDEEADPAAPIAELSDEDKKQWFKKSAIPDLTAVTLNAAFAKYSFPDKSEGFDEVKYEWQNAAKSTEYLTNWRQEKKITARVEDLKVGEWFESKQKEWSKFLQTCKQKQNDYKNNVAKRVAEKASKEKMKQMKVLQAKAAAAQVKATKEKKEKLKVLQAEQKEKLKEAKAKIRADKIAAGEEVPEEEPEKEEPEKEVEEEPEAMEVEEEKEEEPEADDEVVDIDKLDVFGIDDIFECGGNPVQQPLFSQFAFEDWALMSLRFELNLLVHAFKKDVKDPERNSVHEDNIGFYYQKYFRKGLNSAFFGVKTVRELLAFFSDTVSINSKKILETFLPGDFEVHSVFVLLAEESRRDRQRRVDMGEEGAKINMQTGQLSQMMGNGTNPSIAAMQAAAMQRSAAGLQAGVPHTRPFGPGMVRPGMPTAGAVRPPLQTWGAGRPPTPAWRPAGGGVPPMGGAWAGGGVRPMGAMGMGMGHPQQVGMMRPMMGGMVRPGMVRPAWG